MKRDGLLLKKFNMDWNSTMSTENEMGFQKSNCCDELSTSHITQQEGFFYRDTYQNVIGFVFMFIIFVLSITGNIAVLLAIYKTPSLQENQSSLCLVNLSLVDILSAILVMPYSAVALLADDWLLGAYWCSAQCALNYCCIIVSMLTLSFMSVDRNIGITHPLRYPLIMTKTLTKAMATYSWIQGLAFAAVPLIYQWVVYDYWEVVCAIDWDSYRDHGGLIYVIVAFVVCFLVPAIIMTICYAGIYREITQHYQRRLTRQHNRLSREQLLEERKVIISFAVVIIMFFICNTPFCVSKVVKIFFSTDALPCWVNFVATYMQYIASATNPFIYGIFRQDFRKAFSKIFCKSRKNPVHPVKSISRRESVNATNNDMRNNQHTDPTIGDIEMCP